MSEDLRRSKRLLGRKPQESKPEGNPEFLAVQKDNSYVLGIAKAGIPKRSQSFPITLLKSAGAETKFKEADEVTVHSKDILCLVSVTKNKTLYQVTKKELEKVQAEAQAVSSEYESEEEIQPKKRVASKKAKAPPKKTKTGKTQVYKKGFFNHAVKPVDFTKEMLDPSNKPFFGISIQYNNRNLHRAAATSNKKLFDSLLASKGKISRVMPYWGPDCKILPIEIAVFNGNEQMVKGLLKEIEKPKFKRAYEPDSALQHVGSGYVSNNTFGVRVRSVQMSRGGREGNNAFIADSDNSDDYSRFAQSLLGMIERGVSPKMLQVLHTESNYVQQVIWRHVGDAVRTGNLELAKFMISWFNKLGGYGWNFLHEDVLKKANLPAFKKVSVTKKPIENYCIAPLHVACINPDTKHLKSLLEQCDDPGYQDIEGRRCVHYAAACTSTSPLELLLQSSNPNEMDRLKFTPLMVTAKYNRPENAKFLIAKGANVQAKNKLGFAAVHIAAERGNHEVLEVLLKNGATIDMPGPDRKTALMFAAAQGYMDCLKLLIENGAKVIKKDKCKRTALTWAVKNGHTAEASYLLSQGSEYDFPDSSKNYPIHYAAAYGWPECIEVLIQAGADINCENDWKLQPLLVAMLKGQVGCVDLLLRKPGIDVNCKDEKGRTLLSQSVEMLSEETLSQMEYLLKNCAADPNLPDTDGKTPLHHLCEKGPPVCNLIGYTEEAKTEWEEEESMKQQKALRILVDNNSDVNLFCKQGSTPIMCALRSRNTKLVEMLVEVGADLTVKSKSGGVFHMIAAFDQKFFPVIHRLLDFPEVNQDSLNSLDEEGHNPVHLLMISFASNYQRVENEIREKHRKNMEKELEAKRKEMMDIEKKQSKTPARSRSSGQTPKGHFPKKQGFFEGSHQVSNQSLFQGSQQIDNQELAAKVDQEMKVVVEEFIEVLKHFFTAGCDPKASVQKLKKYREDPQLIHKEEEEALNNHRNERTLEKFFITDFEGNKLYKEYGENGMKNLFHLLSQRPVYLVLEFLLNLGLEINQRDFYGRTPLYSFVSKGATHQIQTLLDYSSDPNIADYTGRTPLHVAAKQGNSQIVKILLENGAELNIVSKDGEFPLKSAVENNDLVTTRILLDSGADPNLTDNKKRTSLHIAFNASNSSADASFDMESLLLRKGANINAMDCRHRTPLHYCFVKIGRPFEMSQIDPIETVSSACTKQGINVNVQDAWSKTPLHYAAQRGALTSSMFMLSVNAGLDLPDEDGNTPLALAFLNGHPNYAIMLIQKGADVNKPMIVKRRNSENVENVPFEEESENESEDSGCISEESDDSASYFGGGLFGNSGFQNTGFGNSMPRNTTNNQNPRFPEGTYSLFRAGIMQGWQGASYLLLYNGYDYMRAIQDAMNEKKFQLVRTLLSKVNEDHILQQKNEKGQNLFHTLAMKGSGTDLNTSRDLCEQLLDRGIDPKSPDSDMRSPLHYAASSNYTYMCGFLLDNGADWNLPDSKGEVPLALGIKGNKIKNARAILRVFAERGANLSFKFESEGVTLAPLLHAIKKQCGREMISELVDLGCSVTEKDNLGRGALIYSILNNDTELVEALLRTQGVEPKETDFNGRNSVHYVVQPMEGASYENVEILKTLISYGADPHQKDNLGYSPYWYAAQQKSGRMLQNLTKLAGSESVEVSRRTSVYEDKQIDFLKDAQEYVESQKDLEKVEDEGRKPDLHGGFTQTFEVIDDYDIIMIRVDISYGPFSAYLFYRMQLLHETNRGVYVLFTRWGRIGEVGAYQRTAFSSKEEAETEFKKIFKAKSGNEWGQPFVRKPGKYSLQNLETKTVKHKNFIKDFDLKNAPPSQLDKKLRRCLKVLCKVSIYNQQFSQCRSNPEVLNFSSIKKETLEEAGELLEDIKTLINKLQKAKTVEVKLELKTQIADLSSRFYELIPMTIHSGGLVPPIQELSHVSNCHKIIENLKDYEVASKIFIGALRRQYEMNPLDYVVQSIPANIKTLSADHSDYKVIQRYLPESIINNLLSIYKVNRKGEAERISKFDKLKTRKLLWHGTGISNVIGILSQGLRLSYANNGMFGKGIYFADMFEKSSGFCYDFSRVRKNRYYMLLCEVVLGNVFEPNQTGGGMPKNYKSVLGLGFNYPDPSGSIYMNNGVEVPVGKTLSRNRQDTNKPIFLNYNEYIVYDEDQVRIRYLVELKSN